MIFHFEGLPKNCYLYPSVLLRTECRKFFRGRQNDVKFTNELKMYKPKILEAWWGATPVELVARYMQDACVTAPGFFSTSRTQSPHFAAPVSLMAETGASPPAPRESLEDHHPYQSGSPDNRACTATPQYNDVCLLCAKFCLTEPASTVHIVIPFSADRSAARCKLQQETAFISPTFPYGRFNSTFLQKLERIQRRRCEKKGGKVATLEDDKHLSGPRPMEARTMRLDMFSS